jgi:uncharacterized protein YbaR (Trm112 family)
MIDDELLKILACPACKTPVGEEKDGLLCLNAECRRFYRIDDGIPVMLIDEATVIAPEEWKPRADAARKVD